jgi:hypothetical protein
MNYSNAERLARVLRGLEDDAIAQLLWALFEESAALRGAEAEQRARDLARLLAVHPIELPREYGVVPDYVRREFAQRAFWHIVTLGLGHDTDAGALILHAVLDKPITISSYQAQDLSVIFTPVDRPAEDQARLLAFHARIVASELPSVDARIALALKRFPAGAEHLEALAPRSAALANHAEDLLRYYISNPAQHTLTFSLLREVWRAAPDAIRSQHLNELANNPQAQRRAIALGADALWAEELASEQERALLLRLHDVFPERDWHPIAAPLLDSPNPQLRATALDALADATSREFLPALSAARVQAGRGERARIDAIIRAIQVHDPRPGDSLGALSVAEEDSVEGALSLAGAQAGELSAAGEMDAPQPLVAAQAPAALSTARDVMLSRWEHMAPAPRRVPLSLRLALSVFGSTGRRASIWCFMALGLLAPVMSVQQLELLKAALFYGGGVLLSWAILSEQRGGGAYLKVLAKAPGAVARVEDQFAGKTTLVLPDGATDELKGMGLMEPGTLVPVWRLSRGVLVELFPLERCRPMRLDPDGGVRAHTRYAVAAPILMLLGLLGIASILMTSIR